MKAMNIFLAKPYAILCELTQLNYGFLLGITV